MNVGSVNVVGIAYLAQRFDISKHLSGGMPFNAEIQCFASQVSAVGHSAGIRIMLCAADTARTVAGSAKVAANIVGQLDQSMIRFNGESIAVGFMILPAAAPEFLSVHELIAFIREWDETNPPLTGISFDSDKLTFDGFGQAADADHVQTFMKLAGAMNNMALTQLRVQAKDVDDSNEKYSLRVWLIRLGLNGNDCKADRKRLLENLSGHTAFRNDAERERWEAKQKAKRDAQNNEEEENDAVSE